MNAPTDENVSVTPLMIFERNISVENDSPEVIGVRGERANSARRKTGRKSPVAREKISNSPTPEAVAISDFIDNWQPSISPAKDEWVAIAPRVRELVKSAQPGGIEFARKNLQHVSTHLASQYKKGNRLDDVAALFSDRALETTYGSATKPGFTPSTRAVGLTYLLRLRAHLVPAEYAKRPSLRVGRSSIVNAYSDDELAKLFTWARLSENANADRVLAALVLGVACGLDGYESRKIRGTDVLRTPWGLVVRAPGIPGRNFRPARLVPVIGDYEMDMARLARTFKGDLMLEDSQFDTSEPRSTLSRVQPYKTKVVMINSRRTRMTWTKKIVDGEASFIGIKMAGVSIANDRVLAAASKGATLPMERYVKQLRISLVEFAPENFLDLALLS
jgi:hypothetical protein